MTVLYHFTCDHGHAGLQHDGIVVPAVFLHPNGVHVETGKYAWFTNLAIPDRDALGLTSYALQCDRTLHRYRAVNPSDLHWWPLVGDRYLTELLTCDGGKPDLWWISRGKVKVIYDPVGGAS